MQKVAIFGKPANGKSTLSKKLATATGLPLYAVDSMLYLPDGREVDRAQYDTEHNRILASDRWIIEGFGPMNSLDSFRSRLAHADTLIYIELPYWVTYGLVIKRFIKGLYKTPEGWPEGSSVLQGTLESFKVLKQCPRFWNEDFLKRIQDASTDKSFYVIRSVSALNGFVKAHQTRDQ